MSDVPVMIRVSVLNRKSCLNTRNERDSEGKSDGACCQGESAESMGAYI